MSRAIAIAGLVASLAVVACTRRTSLSSHAGDRSWSRDETTAITAYRAGRYGDAEIAIEEAVRAAEAAGTPAADRARLLQTRAEVYRVSGRYAEAEADLAWVCSWRESALGSNDPQLARCLSNLGLVKGNQRNPQEAEQLFRRALAILEQALGPDHPDTAMVRCNLADVATHLGRCPEAEAEQRRALAARERALAPTDPDVARSLAGLAAAIACQAGRYGEAEPLYHRSTMIWERVAPGHPTLGLILRDWGRAAVADGRNPEAEPLFRRALAIEEKALKPEHPAIRSVAEDYAALLRRSGRDADATALSAQYLGGPGVSMEHPRDSAIGGKAE